MNRLKTLRKGDMTGSIHALADYTNLVARMQQSPVMLIRHAKSGANYYGDTMSQQTTHTAAKSTLSDLLETRDVTKKIGPILCDKGITQCEKLGEQLHSYDFRVIISSPLRRAIETSYYTFRSHPNFSKMKIILHPLFRERLNLTGDCFQSNQDF